MIGVSLLFLVGPQMLLRWKMALPGRATMGLEAWGFEPPCFSPISMEEKEGKLEIEFSHVANDLLIQAYIMGAQLCPTLFDSMD